MSVSAIQILRYPAFSSFMVRGLSILPLDGACIPSAASLSAFLLPLIPAWLGILKVIVLPSSSNILILSFVSSVMGEVNDGQFWSDWVAAFESVKMMMFVKQKLVDAAESSAFSRAVISAWWMLVIGLSCHDSEMFNFGMNIAQQVDNGVELFDPSVNISNVSLFLQSWSVSELNIFCVSILLSVSCCFVSGNNFVSTFRSSQGGFFWISLRSSSFLLNMSLIILLSCLVARKAAGIALGSQSGFARICFVEGRLGCSFCGLR